MNLFGMADASEVDDNPFKIDPNTYRMRIINAELTEKEDGNLNLKVVWQINEPDNKYHERKVTQYHRIINKKTKDMDKDELQTMEYYKMFLRKGLDLSETEMNSLSAQDLLNREAYITTSVNKEGFNNANKVLCPRLYAEQNGGETDINKSMGIASSDSVSASI